MTKKLWPMKAINSGKAEILIYGDIGDGYFGGLTSLTFIEQLAAFGAVTEIDIRINSWGGIASEGIAIHNALVRHPAKKTVYIDAICASAATYPALAASPGCLRIPANARMMIHNAALPEFGDKKAHRAVGDRLESLDKQIAGIYAPRLKLSEEEILALMDAETWYTGDEAVAAGLADVIDEAQATAAVPKTHFELSWFRHVPADLAAAYAAIGKPAEPREEWERDAAAVAVRMRMLELDNAALAAS